MSIDWLLTWTTVYALASVVMAIILGATAWWARHQLHEVRRSRQLACLMTLSQEWSSEVMREARMIANSAGSGLSEALAKMEEQNSADYYKVITLANFFEVLAILEEQSKISAGQVNDYFGPPARHYHNLFRPYIERQQTEEPAVFQKFDNLARQLDHLEQATSSQHP